MTQGVAKASLRPPAQARANAADLAPPTEGSVVDDDRNLAYDEELSARVLAIARRSLGTDAVWLSRFDQPADEYTVAAVAAEEDSPLVAGMKVPLTGTYCALMVAGELPNMIADAKNDQRTADLGATEGLDMGSYVGVPVRGTRSVFGTLCGLSHHPQRHARRDIEVLEVLAEVLARDTEQQRTQEHDRALAGADVVRRFEADFVPAFQPIFDLETGRIIGAEGLARFRAGATNPLVRFAEAEQLGVREQVEIIAIGRLCGEAASLPSDVYLAVNASPSVVLGDQLAPAVAPWARARTLVIEVTEHHQAVDSSALSESARQLQAAGVEIAVDDAGSGYSSLARIVALKPDMIKADQILITGIDADPARQAMLTGLVAIAEKSALTLVVEGIETERELETVIGLGGRYAQGYLLGRPQSLPLPDGPANSR